MRLIVDGERCQGHGRCYALQPALFVDDEDGKGHPIVEDVEGDAIEAARAAVAACPEQAIALH